ncbi:Ger(x)C family spore germination protein [Paenibacillus sp. NEAU-GSW1]|uniref:Ger(x)C family spore germination protein n=1 Tax=Paenibacillus sp. NEAU-GSW1 TaxID=2682486 RepID=UPI0012E2D4DE|nr:Ger(x)C family spore germination protein [Paenibacillus sp. NEAU-GSW1]MUT65896.1 Ger(x)C family spore germination protein [Paenibacillus sp. NEAU-GSW1]
MPAFVKCILAISLLFTATGCWDEMNLQKISYISALGVDFVDDHYVVYAQLVSFGSIAKKEQGSISKNPIWIGTQKGDTPLHAMFNLMNSSQYILTLDHLKTIIVHERAFSRLTAILEGLNRMRATRYTTYVFGTKDNLDKVLTIDSFFESSPLTSVMFDPSIVYEENNFVKATRMEDIVRLAFEPGMTLLMPNLKSNGKEWTNDDKQMNLVTIDGVFAFKNNLFKGFFPKNEVKGLGWRSENFQRQIVTVNAKDEPKNTASVVLTKGEMKIRWDARKSVFRLRGDYMGHIVEWNPEFNFVSIVSTVEAKIKEQIKSTYKIGLDYGVDLFPLEHELYRYHNSKWKELKRQGEWMPNADELLIDINVSLSHSGEIEVH